MISAHQPTIFPDKFHVVLSSVSDGTMKHSATSDPDEITRNREVFLEDNGHMLETTQLVNLVYEGEDYCRYGVVDDEGAGTSMHPDVVVAPRDALATDTREVTLFLPIADCCALVLADEKRGAIMLSHLGRHSVEQNGGQKSVQFMVEEFGSDPDDLLAWLSPAVGSQTYPLREFNGHSLQEVIVSQLSKAGIHEDHIEICDVDTAQDDRYYSHSEFKKGNREFDGRMAVTATIVAS